MKQLEFKKYYVGNFYIEKVCRPYQNDFLSKVTRSNGYLYKVREVVRKAGYVPFIIVGDNLGMWKSEFTITTNGVINKNRQVQTGPAKEKSNDAKSHLQTNRKSCLVCIGT